MNDDEERIAEEARRVAERRQQARMELADGLPVRLGHSLWQVSGADAVRRAAPKRRRWWGSLGRGLLRGLRRLPHRRKRHKCKDEGREVW